MNLMNKRCLVNGADPKKGITFGNQEVTDDLSNSSLHGHQGQDSEITQWAEELERYETNWEESSNERIGKKFGGITWLDHFIVGQRKKRVEDNSYMLALKKKRLKIQENKGISDGVKSLKKAE